MDETFAALERGFVMRDPGLVCIQGSNGDFGSSADARFYDRLFMFVWATLYGVGAIYLFEVFWPQRNSISQDAE